MFGFLFRKTDFFTNAEKSHEIIEVQFKKYLNKYQDKMEREKKIRERKYFIKNFEIKKSTSFIL